MVTMHMSQTLGKGKIWLVRQIYLLAAKQGLLYKISVKQQVNIFCFLFNMHFLLIFTLYEIYYFRSCSDKIRDVWTLKSAPFSCPLGDCDSSCGQTSEPLVVAILTVCIPKQLCLVQNCNFSVQLAQLSQSFSILLLRVTGCHQTPQWHLSHHKIPYFLVFYCVKNTCDKSFFINKKLNFFLTLSVCVLFDFVTVTSFPKTFCSVLVMHADAVHPC